LKIIILGILAVFFEELAMIRYLGAFAGDSE
jgi:hypothetical protein